MWHARPEEGGSGPLFLQPQCNFYRCKTSHYYLGAWSRLPEAWEVKRVDYLLKAWIWGVGYKNVANWMTGGLFYLTVHPWRMWQVFHHRLQLEDPCQSSLQNRHPHVQVRRLRQDISHSTQAKSSWKKISNRTSHINVKWRGAVRCSLLMGP